MQTNDQVSRTQELKVYGSLKSNLGEVALLGMVRAPEFGANAFCIELKSRRPMYGEWRTNIQPKSHDFAVEIISFGYTDPANIWNPSKHARLDFSRKDIENIQILIREIFDDQYLRRKIFPFNVKSAAFTGEIFGARCEVSRCVKVSIDAHSLRYCLWP